MRAIILMVVLAVALCGAPALGHGFSDEQAVWIGAVCRGQRIVECKGKPRNDQERHDVRCYRAYLRINEDLFRAWLAKNKP